MIYLGIDPGQSGGMAAIAPGDRVQVWPCPVTERDTWNVLTDIRDGHLEGWPSVTALLEKVHSMPGQGVASTFKFGVNYGGWRMALTAAGIPWEDVTPQVWQKGLAIPQKKPAESRVDFKNRLKARAQQIFPAVKVTLAIADALLICEYCKRKKEGTL